MAYTRASTMDNKLDESSGNARDSIIYDDVVSEEEITKDSITEDASEKSDSNESKGESLSVKNPGQNAPESAKQIDEEEMTEKSSKKVGGELKKELPMKENATSDSGTDKKESYEHKRKFRKDSHDKELWTPVKSDFKENICISDEAKIEDEILLDSPGDQPTKPPRRHLQKKPENKKQIDTECGEVEQKASLLHSPDPVKPPRRCLPPLPTPGVHPKPDIDSATSDLSSASKDSLEQKPTEIVCKPVLTSSPNQDEFPSVMVEKVDSLDTSRRTLSYLDVSSETGTRKRVESFYDFLYSRDDVTSPISNDSDRNCRAMSHSEEHLYDAVEVEDSLTESYSQKSHSGSTYEEVIVNQEAYVMPSQDEESDEFSDTDPWGSDFETEDDLTDVASLRTQEDFNDDEEDPYDSVEISPMRERKRPFKFVSEITNFSPFKRPSGSLGVPGLKGQLKGCLGLNKASSMPYLPGSAKNQKDDETDGVYVDPDITDSVNYQQPVMPPMPGGLTTDQIKRYQIVKFMLESEADYMRLLDQLSKTQARVKTTLYSLLQPSDVSL